MSCLTPSTGTIQGTLERVKISTSGTYSALVLPSSSMQPTLMTIVPGYPSEVRYSRLPHSPQKCVVMVLPLPALRGFALSVPLSILRSSVNSSRLLLKPLPVRRRSSTEWQRNWSLIRFGEVGIPEVGGWGMSKEGLETDSGYWFSGEGDAVRTAETN